VKKDIWHYLDKTGDPALIDYKLHDFGLRGAPCMEAGGIGGSAHLVNFKGTDNVPALITLRDYYHAKMDRENIAGKSIAAYEHSTIVVWRRVGEALAAGEARAMENALVKFPAGPLAVVSDSYDIFNACSNIWGGSLKDKVVDRDGVLIVRPDSGSPADVTLKVLDILGDKFGYSENVKGYKVLFDKIRMIWGECPTLDVPRTVLGAMCREGWSADNLAFGMGGALIQKHNRDTY